jgi:hypothetical protein
MDKEQELLFTVNGFIFGSEQDAELAKQELNTAKYIEKKIDNKSPATMLAIYKASIDKKMFRTPVGYAYLHDLQKRMALNGISGADIGGIPLYQIFNNHHEDEKAPRVIKVKKKKDPLKRRNTLLTIINIILVLLVIAMFAISVSGDRPTVLNYRRTIENEYSSWKQQLDEREKAIREKERELDIVYGNE